MNVKDINLILFKELGDTIDPGELFPNLASLKTQRFQFRQDIGLSTFPTTSGLILIRGARQVGKSTWLEQQIVSSHQELGPASTFYLNGDYLLDREDLETEILNLLPLYKNRNDAVAPRLFIDEITAVAGWQTVLKRLYDSGQTRHLLIVTTGSQAQDLRRGKERLPGRKGKLDRTEYLFPPLSYTEFRMQAGDFFEPDSVIAYLLTGGSPLAINELADRGQIPPFVYALTRDWLLGQCAQADRSPNILTWLFQALFKVGPNPVAVNQLARDAGVANNTVIQGYIDLLQDCLALGIALPWDLSQGRSIPRKAAKYPFIHLLSAWSFLPERPASVADFTKLPQNIKGAAWEWLVAQELWRQRALRGIASPEMLGTYQSQGHGIDFVLPGSETVIEVKAGTATPAEFTWFARNFPEKKLVVVGQSEFQLPNVKAVTFAEFLSNNLEFFG